MSKIFAHAAASALAATIIAVGAGGCTAETTTEDTAKQSEAVSCSPEFITGAPAGTVTVWGNCFLPDGQTVTAELYVSPTNDANCSGDSWFYAGSEQDVTTDGLLGDGSVAVQFHPGCTVDGQKIYYVQALIFDPHTGQWVSNGCTKMTGC